MTVIEMQNILKKIPGIRKFTIGENGKFAHIFLNNVNKSYMADRDWSAIAEVETGTIVIRYGHGVSSPKFEETERVFFSVNGACVYQG